MIFPRENCHLLRQSGFLSHAPGVGDGERRYPVGALCQGGPPTQRAPTQGRVNFILSVRTGYAPLTPTIPALVPRPRPPLVAGVRHFLRFQLYELLSGEARGMLQRAQRYVTDAGHAAQLRDSEVMGPAGATPIRGSCDRLITWRKVGKGRKVKQGNRLNITT